MECSGVIIPRDHRLPDPIKLRSLNIGNVRLKLFWRNAENFITWEFGFAAVIATHYDPVIGGDAEYDRGGVAEAVAGVKGNHRILGLQSQAT